MADNKLPINTILAQLDAKNYDYYDSLRPEDKKKIAPFLLNRYMSLVQGDVLLQSYYLMATNQQVNVNYFDLAKEPKLVWQLLCTVSPGMGKQFHKWVGNKKKTKTSGADIFKGLMKLYPSMKEDEVELLASKMSKKEYKQLLDEHGITEKDL